MYAIAPCALGAYIGWATARARWVASAAALALVLILGAVLFSHLARWPARFFDTSGGDMGDFSFWDVLIPFVVTPCGGFLVGIEAGIGVTRFVRRTREPRLR
jgi:hypothetical protein